MKNYLKYFTYIILSVLGIFLLALLSFLPWQGMKNPENSFPKENIEGSFIKVSDGKNIFVYEYLPWKTYKSTVYIISGITGINHNSEKDIIEKLSNNENRVVVIHPRGTGYSEGKRGDILKLSDFVNDYVEVIKADKSNGGNRRKIILYGHSMSCAVVLAVAEKLEKVDGVILVNPPYRLKSARGMSPSTGDYLKYISYFVFAPHVPVVNMAGDPSKIENENDRKESELRNNDPLLVKYFSMFYMNESRKIMDTMADKAKNADYPLLLVYGTKDSIIEKSGCDELFTSWKNKNKKYEIVENGPHGKQTVLKAIKHINKWMLNLINGDKVKL